MRLNYNVDNIIYNQNTNVFQVISGSHKSNTKKVIFCMPQQALLNIDYLRPIHCILEKSITCKSLCRVYAIFKKEDVWFHDLKQKIVTNNELRYIIPIDANKGIIMISYTDDIYTHYWNNIKDNQQKLKESIVKLVYKTFRFHIKKPYSVIVYNWDCGVAYWNKNIDSTSVSKYLINPLPNVYICGENYSKKQSWVEGALETSNECVNKIIHSV